MPIEITQCVPYREAAHVGHCFDLRLTLDQGAHKYVLRWLEKTNIPYAPGQPENIWFDLAWNIDNNKVDGWGDAVKQPYENRPSAKVDFMVNAGIMLRSFMM